VKPVDLMLWLQRRAHLVPAPVRRLASGWLARLGIRRTAGPSEDWTAPLVPGRGTADLTGAAGAMASPSEPSVPTTATPRLHCLIATDYLDVGGAQEFAAFLSRRLPRHGFRVTVAYGGRKPPGQPGPGGRLADELAAEGIATVQLRPEESTDWLRAHRPDVVSAHYAPDWLLDAAAAAGVPWVETLHGMHSFFHPDSWAPERIRARRISAQVAVSDLVRRQYLARNPEYPSGRLVTVPNGADRSRVATADREQARAALGLRDEFLFVSLARYCLQKNTFGLVSAFLTMAERYPEAHLLVAGRMDDPVYYAQVLRLARSSPYADRIHLRGHCRYSAALLAAADAFVLDSFFEGWSLSSMEALAAGTPVVLSDVGGAREQLAGGEPRGLLVANPGGDPELVDWARISELRFREQPNRADFAAAMSTMVRDRERWLGRREGVGLDAVSRFSAQRCAERHASVLRAVVRGDGLPDYSATRFAAAGSDAIG
jgi:glycosyltransferase involved in cell wall biosynthesis